MSEKPSHRQFIGQIVKIRIETSDKSSNGLFYFLFYFLKNVGKYRIKEKEPSVNFSKKDYLSCFPVILSYLTVFKRYNDGHILVQDGYQDWILFENRIVPNQQILTTASFGKNPIALEKWRY